MATNLIGWYASREAIKQALKIPGVSRNRLIDRLEHSERSGSWPGRVPAMVDLDVPRWSNLRS